MHRTTSLTSERGVIVLGAGGHARVVVDTLHAMGCDVIGALSPGGDDRVGPVPVLGGDEKLALYPPAAVLVAIGIGGVRAVGTRRLLYDFVKARGYTVVTLVHPSAVVASDVRLGEGAQLMAGVVVQPGAEIDEGAIVNTRASIDHDCHIGAHVHVAPGVTLSGGVDVGEGVHIGVGATVLQGVRIGAGSTVAAGAVVVRDVSPHSVVLGVPAKEGVGDG